MFSIRTLKGLFIVYTSNKLSRRRSRIYHKIYQISVSKSLCIRDVLTISFKVDFILKCSVWILDIYDIRGNLGKTGKGGGGVGKMLNITCINVNKGVSVLQLLDFLIHIPSDFSLNLIRQYIVSISEEILERLGSLTCYIHIVRVN